ncbi:CRTAC1 family protein [Reichenbachiella versicolor]|uniref:CRTAC1 family protein n=1 Tax=Reichenbachiella versicolor TaxID=1821036 RepID=UPI000D6DC6A0|nr:CRTAC1 family protein [Reichenbachiella versicolor]
MSFQCIYSFLTVVFLAAFFQDGLQAQHKGTIFSESSEIVRFEKKSRRKWDSPVICDLDQDGYLDLLLTDHARRVEVYWNNKGRFDQGTPFIFGDTHGIAVSDIDRDGRIDVIVQPGGGGGKKLSQTRVFTINKDRTVEGGQALSHLENSRGRAVKLIDADNNGDLDMLLTAFAAKKTLSHANFMYKADKQKKFSFVDYLPHGHRFSMRAALTDIDNDRDTDLLFYGGSNFVSVMGLEGIAFENKTNKLFGELKNTENVSAITNIDIDNDGDMDLLLTRAKHPFETEAQYNESDDLFYFFVRGKPYEFDSLKIDGDFRIENLQMAYPHFDVFVGRNTRLLKLDEDRHAQQDFVLSHDEANGFPEDTSAKGLYIGSLGNGYWKIKINTKSPTSGVIHQVVAKPETINLEDMPVRLLRNDKGDFEDVSEEFGVNMLEQASGAVSGDFDNDGWTDMVIIKYGHSAEVFEQVYYKNLEGKGFEKVEGHGVIRTELGATGAGIEAFDYDKDGDLDIVYGNERGRWHLFTNELDSRNHYVVVKVGNSPTGKSLAMGAELTLVVGDKIYKRTIGVSSAYSCQSFDNYLHVGLGQSKKVDKAEIVWSNGERQVLKIKKVNRTYFAGQ